MINEKVVSDFIKTNKVIAIDKTELDIYLVVENSSEDYSLYRYLIPNKILVRKISNRSIKVIVNKLLKYRKYGYEY